MSHCALGSNHNWHKQEYCSYYRNRVTVPNRLLSKKAGTKNKEVKMTTLKKIKYAFLGLLIPAVGFAQEVPNSVPQEAKDAFNDIKTQAGNWATEAIGWVAGIVGAVIVIYFMIKAIRWVKRAINAAS